DSRDWTAFDHPRNGLALHIIELRGLGWRFAVSRAGKTTWVSQAAMHITNIVAYFDVSNTPGPALSGFARAGACGAPLRHDRWRSRRDTPARRVTRSVSGSEPPADRRLLHLSTPTFKYKTASPPNGATNVWFPLGVVVAPICATEPSAGLNHS